MFSSRSGASGRGGLTSRFRANSFWIACESDAGELPVFFELKEIAISPANVRANDHFKA
jgi:hypothetical protein